MSLVSTDSSHVNLTVSDSVLIEAELLNNASQFEALCTTWKARGVGVVMPLVLHDESTWTRLQAAVEMCAEQKIPLWLRIEYSNVKAISSYMTFQTFDLARDALPLFSDVGEIVSAIAVPKLENELLAVAPRLSWSNSRNITGEFFAHAQRQFRDITDDWGQARIFLWSRCLDTACFDVLDADATQNAIASTRSALQSVLVSEEARSAVRGIVLDAPSLWNQNVPDALRRFPWHDSLPQVFKAHHATEFTDALPSLIADTGADAVRVRLDFWASVTQLIVSNFGQVWRAFADENNWQLRFDWQSDTLNHTVARGGDITQLARLCDSCGLRIEAGTPTSTRATLRLFQSLLELQQPDDRRGRVFIRKAEIPLREKSDYWHAGATGFETPYNLTSDPQNETLLAAYTARVCDVLAQGRSAARVGVLWPSRSLSAHHHPKAHRFVRWVEEDVVATMQMLDSLHLDFLFLPPDELENGVVQPRVLDKSNEHNAILACGAAQFPFECVVLPSVTCLSRAVWRKLGEFVQAGGKVVCLGLLPRWSEVGRDAELEAEVQRQTRTNIEDVYDSYRHQEQGTLDELHQSDPSSVGYPVVRQTLSGGRFSTYQPRLNPDPDDARLRVRGLLVESVTPEVETQSATLKHRVRLQNNATTFWTLNDNERSHGANLLLRPRDEVVSLEKYNAWRDTSTRCAVWMSLPSMEGGGAAFSSEYAHDETHIFHLRSDAQSAAPHLESATFEVESFDGKVARGFATQSLKPSISLRINGRLQQFFGTSCVVDPPLSLNEWSVEEMPTHIKYSMNCTLPTPWREFLQNDRGHLCLQIAPPSGAVAVEALFNNIASERVFAAPWTFELPREIAQVEALQIELRVWSRDNDGLEELAARIVAYPCVEVVVP